LVVAAAACKEAKIAERAVVAGVEPQVTATVVTIQTVLQPQNKTFLHSIVIANGRARSSDEIDRWRLFDLDHDRVTFVDDLARTYYTLPFGGTPPTSTAITVAPEVRETTERRVVEGVETTQYIISLGGYQRQLWIGSPQAIPPKLFGMMNATDDGLSKLQGFPMIDHSELPYGKSKLLVDRTVVKIEQKNVPQSSLNVPDDYKEITAPGGRRPPASSPPPDQSTRAKG
jgi:hypothetical protein